MSGVINCSSFIQALVATRTNSTTIGRDAFRTCDCGDLRSYEVRPIGNDLRLTDPARQTGAAQVAGERFTHCDWGALSGAIGHP